MADDAMDIDQESDQFGGDGSSDRKKEGPNTSTSSSQPGPTSSASPVPEKRFKYKYPEAHPTPPGEDDVAWNKLFTAADSRLYNKHGKNATESKKYRSSGATYELALQMLKEKKDKAAAIACGALPPPKSSIPKVPTPKKAPAVKAEPSSSSRDATPFTDKMFPTMSISEKIKSEGRARKAPSSAMAAASDSDVPGPSFNTSTLMGSPAPPAPKFDKPKKKGTAFFKRRPGPKPKAENIVGTPSSSRAASMTPGPRTGPSSGSESNDGGEYCICRGPDDHRMMVYCEGGCEDWYHCSCLKMDVEDSKELLDRFICPQCTNSESFTTWKRMCRYGNVGRWLNESNACRKSARVSTEPPSKYCSDDHREKFWHFVQTLARKDNEPSHGGILNKGEVGWILSQGLNAEQLHNLGSRPKLPSKEGADPNRPPGLDYLTEEEEKQLQDISARQETIEIELAGYRNQENLRGMIISRAEKAAAYLQLKSVKELCGYDNRLAVNQAQFAKWSKTEEGKHAFETGVLGPRTVETTSIGAHVLMPGQVVPNISDLPNETSNICTKKKCAKHNGWAAVHKDDISYSYNLLMQENKKLTNKRNQIIENAELMEAMKDEYSDNVTIQYF